MKLSPLDIRHMEFERGAVGYHRRQVRDFLDRAAREHEALLEELLSLRRTLSEREAEVEALRSSEADLKRTVVAAERIGNEVKEGARREADMVIRQARHERYEMLREAAAMVDAARRELARIEQAQGLIREQLRGQLTAFLSALDPAPVRRLARGRADAPTGAFDDDVITALTAAVAAASRDVAQAEPSPASDDDADAVA